MADSHPISLSTGEKVYYLDYPFDYKAFLSSSDGREWKAFCTYLGNSSMLSSHAHAYYVNGLAPPRRISRQLLLEDGFALGRICGEKHGFGTDGEADPTHYAVFEVPLQSSLISAFAPHPTHLFSDALQSHRSVCPANTPWFCCPL